jgi:hypothetical protein
VGAAVINRDALLELKRVGYIVQNGMYSAGYTAICDMTVKACKE